MCLGAGCVIPSLISGVLLLLVPGVPLSMAILSFSDRRVLGLYDFLFGVTLSYLFWSFSAVFFGDVRLVFVFSLVFSVVLIFLMWGKNVRFERFWVDKGLALLLLLYLSYYMVFFYRFPYFHPNFRTIDVYRHILWSREIFFDHLVVFSKLYPFGFHAFMASIYSLAGCFCPFAVRTMGVLFDFLLLLAVFTLFSRFKFEKRFYLVLIYILVLPSYFVYILGSITNIVGFLFGILLSYKVVEVSQRGFYSMLDVLQGISFFLAGLLTHTSIILFIIVAGFIFLFYRIIKPSLVVAGATVMMAYFMLFFNQFDRLLKVLSGPIEKPWTVIFLRGYESLCPYLADLFIVLPIPFALFTFLSILAFTAKMFLKFLEKRREPFEAFILVFLLSCIGFSYIAGGNSIRFVDFSLYFVNYPVYLVFSGIYRRVSSLVSRLGGVGDGRLFRARVLAVFLVFVLWFPYFSPFYIQFRNNVLYAGGNREVQESFCEVMLFLKQHYDRDNESVLGISALYLREASTILEHTRYAGNLYMTCDPEEFRRMNVTLLVVYKRFKLGYFTYPRCGLKVLYENEMFVVYRV